MVFGGVERERLQLNEDTLWSGGPKDATTQGARAGARPELRRLVAEASTSRPTSSPRRCFRARSPSRTCRSAISTSRLRARRVARATTARARSDLGHRHDALSASATPTLRARGVRRVAPIRSSSSAFQPSGPGLIIVTARLRRPCPTASQRLQGALLTFAAARPLTSTRATRPRRPRAGTTDEAGGMRLRRAPDAVATGGDVSRGPATACTSARRRGRAA